MRVCGKEWCRHNRSPLFLIDFLLNANNDEFSRFQRCKLNQPDRPLAYGYSNSLGWSLITELPLNPIQMFDQERSGIRTAENLVSEHLAQILNSRVDAIDESYAFREAQHEGS